MDRVEQQAESARSEDFREWRVAGTSVAGTSHLKSGLPCQDAHGWLVTGGLVAVAVADGAGSAPLSQVGSSVAVRATLASVIAHGNGAECWQAHDVETCLRNCLRDAVAAVEEEATAAELSCHELATTLIVAIASSTLVGAIQVGDGAVVVGDCDGNMIPLTTPVSGEHINETSFITQTNPAALAQLSVRDLAPMHLAVLTDGLQMLGLRMPSGEPHRPFFNPLFEYMSQTPLEEAQEGLRAFLSGGRVAERTDDDRTLVLAHLPRP